MIKRTFLATCLALFLFIIASSSSSAQNSITVSADEINRVAKGLYCPVCESEPLDSCPTQACADWREEIGLQLSAGATKQQIYDDFRARYGDRVLARPPARGLTWLLWLGIPVGVMVGGVWLGRYLRAIRRAEPTIITPPSPSTTDDPYLAQIERELRQ